MAQASRHVLHEFFAVVSHKVATKASLWFYLMTQLEKGLISSSLSSSWQHSVPKGCWTEDLSSSMAIGQRPLQFIAMWAFPAW